jgi:hypothetical protein
MRHTMLLLSVILLGGAGVYGQSSNASPAPTSGRKHLSLAEANDIALSGFEETFTMAAKAMPADKYNFTPASLAIPGANFEGVKMFSTEVKHVAQSNFITYQAMSGLTPAYDVEGITSLKTKDSILMALAASFAFGHKALAMLTSATEQDPMDFQGLKTKETVAAFAIAHAFDHYGQMVEYLRMNGIVPPASAPQPK